MAATRVRMVRTGAVTALAAAAALVLGACGGGGSGNGGGNASATVSTGGGVTTVVSSASITISNFMFTPMAVTVQPGSTISVTNKDSVTHHLMAIGGTFDTGDIGPGKTVTFTAPKHRGTYGYICSIHQYMRGTITVS
jgi:plastocyanin